MKTAREGIAAALPAGRIEVLGSLRGFALWGVFIVNSLWLPALGNAVVLAGDPDGQTGTYFGQNPPGITPQVFAPGLISKPETLTGGITFSAEADVLVYKLIAGTDGATEQMWYSANPDGRWTAPSRMPMDGEFRGWDFQFARTGRRLYFTSRRPAVFAGETSRYSHIWQTDFTVDGWTEPVLVPPPVNEVDSYSGFPSLTSDGTIYFHSERPDTEGKIDIYRARMIDGQYCEVENVGPQINTAFRELDPAIAPDGRSLVFLSNRPSDGPNEYDLFVSYLDAAGNWSTPLGLHALIGKGAGLPGFSADGDYFFYTGVEKEGDGLGDEAKLLAMNPLWVTADALRKPLEPAPYFGLTPPRDRAEVFAPGAISTPVPEIMSGALDGGRRLIFERIPPDFKEGDPSPFFVTELTDAGWTAARPSPYPAAEWYRNFEGPGAPGEMIIARARARETPDDPFLLDLWIVRRTSDGWSEPEELAINSDRFDTWASVTQDGTLFFFSSRDGGYGRHDLYRSEKTDGTYRTAENVGGVINTADSELDPLIAPDESYLIFCSSARGGFGDQDLFVAFRQDDGTWSEPQNMGAAVNTHGEDMRPILSANGKVLFFTSDVSGVLNIHWIDSRYVERLRPAD